MRPSCALGSFRICVDWENGSGPVLLRSLPEFFRFRKGWSRSETVSVGVTPHSCLTTVSSAHAGSSDETCTCVRARTWTRFGFSGSYCALSGCCSKKGWPLPSRGSSSRGQWWQSVRDCGLDENLSCCPRLAEKAERERTGLQRKASLCVSTLQTPLLWWCSWLPWSLLRVRSATRSLQQ